MFKHMSDSLTDRVLALAGIFQAAQLVQKIARKGMTDTEPFEICISTLFKIDASSVDDVYGGAQHLRPGLKILVDLFDKRGEKLDMEITRYVIAVLVLERKLAKKPEMLNKISEGIEHAELLAEHLSIIHENVLATLADIYSDTVSQLSPRIMVNGEGGYIDIPDNANKIRALLLAAIRSAVLWRQKGGGRLQLIFSRNKYVHEAERLLDQTVTLH